jgi:hypothetical protein
MRRITTCVSSLRAAVSTIVLMAVVSLMPSVARGQGVPGTNISVVVTLRSVSMQADTARVEYELANVATSSEPLFHFTVDALAPVVWMSLPEPRQDWSTAVAYRGRSIAEWVVLGDQLAPGSSSPPLAFKAVGLPGIVDFWVRGYVTPAPLTDSDTVPVVSPSDPLHDSSVPGKTVGIEPIPPNSTRGTLIARLVGLRSQACLSNWISDPNVCASLGAKLDQAGQALNHGDSTGAGAQLESFLSELGAQHGSGLPVNDNAYWLLRVNVQFVLRGMPVALFLQGSGATANPPALALTAIAPTATTAKYQDSPSITFRAATPGSPSVLGRVLLGSAAAP